VAQLGLHCFKTGTEESQLIFVHVLVLRHAEKLFFGDDFFLGRHFVSNSLFKKTDFCRGGEPCSFSLRRNGETVLNHDLKKAAGKIRRLSNF
jgi:hypothetical protein